MEGVLCNVISSEIKNCCNQSKFLLLFNDASEARVTSEANKLVFLKVLVKHWKGYMSVTFLLKCLPLKDFGGTSADGTFNAIINVLEMYFPDDDYMKKPICLVADKEAMNFDEISCAVIHVAEFVDWNVPYVHCLNLRLELAMKDS